MVARCALVGLCHLRDSRNHHGGALVNMPRRDKEQDAMELESLELMGIFLGVFGLIVGASSWIPSDWTGRIANLTAGGLLLGIGIWAFLKGRSHRKR